VTPPPVPPETAWEPDPAFWRHRPVAVTGATGFLGSHLVGLLVNLGADVAILERDDTPISAVAEQWRSRVSVVHGPVEDQQTCERLLGEYRAATVFHLAAQTQVGIANRNPLSTFEANVRGTWTLLEAVRRSPDVSAVVTASSDKAYGSQPALPYNEEMPLLAVHPYDVSKACADLLTRTYAATWSVPVAVTRCGNFFGPGDTNWERLVPGTIRAVLEGRRPEIRSDGTPTRDYLYVADGALAYVCLAEALTNDPTLAGEAFNFSNERPLDVLQFTELIQKAAGTSLEPQVLATARHEIDDQWLSAEKARVRLRWSPRYEIEEALALSVAWYRAHLGLP
jgi:CDP-glucose 4,6-dehydratase